MICLWTPVLCTKFQGDWSTRLRFIAIFASVQKHKEEKKSKLWKLVSWKWLERFPSNLECRLRWLADNSVANLVPKGSPRYKGVKMSFFSSCQYTHGVARWLFGPHDTLSCVLIPNLEGIYFVI